MSKSALILLITRVCLGIAVVECVANIAFEAIGKHHATPVWIATMIGGGLTVALRAFWNEKKKSEGE